MKRALRCLGHVALGVVSVAIAGAVLLAITALLMWAGAATANWFGLSVSCGILFFVGYTILGAGIAIGVSLCRDAEARQ